jgi:threonyl-tRNA synthetase
MAPRQVIVIPVMPMFDEYATEVMNKLKKS